MAQGLMPTARTLGEELQKVRREALSWGWPLAHRGRQSLGAGASSGLKRLRYGYSVPPHWHPRDEHLTVISGTFMLGFGDRIDVCDQSADRRFAILSFHGYGRCDIQYVNPADDPSHASAARPLQPRR
jgi:hypothetical protein